MARGTPWPDEPSDSLAPGEAAELCHELTAPEAINLTSEYNRVSYAQWTSIYTSLGEPKTAHAGRGWN